MGRKILPEAPDRVVPSLFPTGPTEVSRTDLEYYAALPPYAMGWDRQSDPRAVNDSEATGMVRRVQGILAEARSLNLLLPPPLLREPRVGKAPPYDFSAPDIRRHWAVDGTERPATGFSINVAARPELWRGWRLAIELARQGIGPRAILIGEGSRFCRNEQWLSTFLAALWHAKIRFYCAGFGEVNRHTLPGFTAYVNAVSGWLGTVRSGARQTRRQQHRLFSRQVPLGLVASPDKCRVLADASSWPILAECVALLAEGTLPSLSAAVGWLRDRGIDRQFSWLQRWLWSPVPEGRYVSYATKHTARKITDQQRVLWDLDISAGGGRRYLVEHEDGEQWEVEFGEGTSPIPAATVQAARFKVRDNRGRPRQQPAEENLIPQRLLRCAHCGCAVKEHWRQDYRDRKSRPVEWSLSCQEVPTIRRRLTCSAQEARQHLSPEHAHHWAGRASDAVWEVLRNALLHTPPEAQEEDDRGSELVRLREQLASAEREFDTLMRRAAGGELGDQQQELIRAWVEKERAARLARVAELQGRVEELSARLLQGRQASASVREASRALRFAMEGGLGEEFKRQIVTQVVEKVLVDLDLGTFAIHISTSVEALQDLRGVLGGARVDITPQCSLRHNIRFVLLGQL